MKAPVLATMLALATVASAEYAMPPTASGATLDNPAYNMTLSILLTSGPVPEGYIVGSTILTHMTFSFQNLEACEEAVDSMLEPGALAALIPARYEIQAVDIAPCTMSDSFTARTE